MSAIKRRKFLTLSSGATAAILLSQCSRESPQASSPGSTLAQAQIVSSEGGLLKVDLEARAQQVQLGDRSANLLTYNGRMPGPRLEAKHGDTIQVRFTNQLSQPTNLHYHGLHIPPTGTGDNVFLEIPPGESHTYEFQLPQNHPAGTFWYHPHYHGLVAEQLFGGLAGLFIVRGELDEIPEVKAAQEKFLVLKDFALDRSGNIPSPGHMAQMTGRMGDLLTVNGQFNPGLQIPQGGLLRLRLLNASSSRFFRLFLEGHPFYLIATDGGAISAPVELRDLVLVPGERVEVLVQGNREPGQYRLFNQPFNPAQGRGGGMMGGNTMGGASSQENAEPIATLTYSGSVDQIPLPTQLISVEPLPEPQTVRQFTLNHGMGMGMAFLINGQAFDPSRIDIQVALDTVEDWEIINTGTMTHPFHVHVNKFQVVSQNGQASPYLAWKDVVSVSPGENVRIRIPFQDYIGKTVYHCHVLDHEDRGMMGILEIQQA
ncbi:multicopper oxidase family protein [Romeria aff. gracilis LEGE 07310]|uniref:Multicopper oxidase family protein n=1 Tax=Vasconcelosia minhoensis LEGE 07310 TaxID=915328 RepID=A0A8J7DCW1_9CYAN|nr:multicopper oxidase family protein [Romeria gracilis]MBE9078098.1 multicopper oxidase family protein [Romeria aff. gracilis LEGE 07310]